MKTLLNTVFLIFLFFNVGAQSPVLIPIESCPTKTIYQVKQAEDKRIWLGTDIGLIKFNGRDYETYYHPGFSRNISGIEIDPTGRVWCQNFSSQIFYLENDSLHLWKDFTDSFPSFPSFTFHHYPNVFVFGRSRDFYKYDFSSGIDKKGEVLRIPSDLLVQYKSANRLDTLTIVTEKPFVFINEQARRENPILISSNFATLYPDGSVDDFKTYYEGDSAPFITSLFIQDLDSNYLFTASYLDKNQSAIQLMKKETAKWFYRANESPLDLEYSGQINKVYIENKRRIWFGGNRGLKVLDLHLGAWIYNQFEQSLAISDITNDHEGNLWVSTLNSGLFIIPNREIELLKPPFICRKIEKAKDKLIMVSKEGPISFFQLTDKQMKEVNIPPVTNLTDAYYNPESLELILGSFPPLRIKLNKSSQSIDTLKTTLFIKTIEYLNETDALILQSDKAIIGPVHSKDETGKIKDSTYLDYGELVINSDPRYYPMEAVTLKSERPNAFAVVDAFRFYISYLSGLVYYDTQGSYTVRSDGEPLKIVELCQGEKVFAASVSNQLFTLNDSFAIPLPTNLSIPKSETIDRMAASSNYLFLVSSGGLIRVSLQDYQVDYFNESDGFPKAGFTDIEIIDSIVFLAAEEGIYYFPENVSIRNKVAPEVFLDEIRLFDKPIRRNEESIFHHSENTFEFVFKSISYKNIGNHRFKYRLKGLEDQWNSLEDNINFARYSGIPPGKYEFEVLAVNEDGVESIEAATFSFKVKRPYYSTWWFISLISILSLLLISAGFGWRIRIIRRENKILNEKQAAEGKLIESQLQALRAQMNPHFMFNALNSIQSYIMLNKKEQAGNYLGLFADLMRRYLEQSKVEKISLEEELSSLEMYLKLEKIRFTEDFKFEVIIEGIEDSSTVKIPSMLIQPFVENAIKHGLLHKSGPKKLLIRFIKEPGHLICTIEDNGIGRQASQEMHKMRQTRHNSHSTGAIRQRLELLEKKLKKSIEVKTVDLHSKGGEASGTKVEIKVPL